MALTMGTIAMDISFTERPVVTRDDIGMAAAYPSTASRPWRPLAEAAVRTIIAYISDNRFKRSAKAPRSPCVFPTVQKAERAAT
jgi:hypothetical protein